MSKRAVFVYLFYLLINLICLIYISKIGSNTIIESMNVSTKILAFLISQPFILFLGFAASSIFIASQPNDEKVFFFSDNVLCPQKTKGAERIEHESKWKDSFVIESVKDGCLMLKSKKTGRVYPAEAASLIDANKSEPNLRLSGIFEMTDSCVIRRVSDDKG